MQLIESGQSRDPFHESRSQSFQVSSRSRILLVSVKNLLPWDFEYPNDIAK